MSVVGRSDVASYDVDKVISLDKWRCQFWTICSLVGPWKCLWRTKLPKALRYNSKRWGISGYCNELCRQRHTSKNEFNADYGLPLVLQGGMAPKKTRQKPNTEMGLAACAHVSFARCVSILYTTNALDCLTNYHWRHRKNSSRLFLWTSHLAHLEIVYILLRVPMKWVQRSWFMLVVLITWTVNLIRFMNGLIIDGGAPWEEERGTTMEDLLKGVHHVGPKDWNQYADLNTWAHMSY